MGKDDRGGDDLPFERCVSGDPGTVPECEAQRGGTPPAEMERDLSDLRELLDRFARQQWGTGAPVHPIFGPLTEREWMRWGYLHMDHHLRQFGA